MNPIFTDLHIHTSQDSNNLNDNYDIDVLLSNIQKKYNIDKTDKIFISLTDHNRINKIAYLKLIGKVSFIVGVELHIRNYDKCKPYHCHVFFDISHDVLGQEIDRINKTLTELYPNPMPSNEDKIPKITDIVNGFNNYDILILPHGGQSHSTFDVSIRHDTVFDTMMEKTIYYNLFDGFTSRSNQGLDKTEEYFKRLGISEFINLITCSDNYDPSNYPNDKNFTEGFIPTWMFASPTFHGLRIALSEKTRFHYGDEPKKIYQEYISECELHNDQIDISVCFTKGLNVIIGNSSSGKTLLVDSIYNSIIRDFSKSNYEKDFKVSKIKVKNDSGITPHYFHQNYLLDMTAKDSPELENNEILQRVFPQDKEVARTSDRLIAELKKDIDSLINSVDQIEKIQKSIKKIPSFARLLTEGKKFNILNTFTIDSNLKERLTYSVADYKDDLTSLEKLLNRQKSIEFFDDITQEIESIKKKIEKAYNMICFENKIRDVIEKHNNSYKEYLNNENQEISNKQKNLENLLKYIREYKKQLDIFYSTLDILSTKYRHEINTKEIESSGHILFIENNLKITKDTILNAINDIRSKNNEIKDFLEIKPATLFLDKFSKKSPKIDSYETAKKKILEIMSKENKVKYKILYKGEKYFDELSPGLKTAVILDVILGYDDDYAPIIIDQPEDNLATSYLNRGLVEYLKKVKKKRQIIIVTHNATIPMLADAETIIICKNNKNKIEITSRPLEGTVANVKVTDIIAELNDGGKTSIKKRFKKYNLKQYKGDDNNGIFDSEN